MVKDSFKALDLVGDVHGMRATFEALLARLGYRRTGRGWRHDEGRHLVSVGDLLDRGPDPLGCLELLEEMVADGVASAVLGNHELNALHFMGGQRPDTARHRRQFQATLDQIAAEPARWERATAFLLTWPFAATYDEGRLRVVHAHWDDEHLARLPARAGEDDALARGAPGGDLFEAMETCLKGPERESPPWTDPEGNVRRRRRVPWWEEHPAEAPMTVFGHYWFPFRGRTVQEPRPGFLGPGGNAACLDWSVARGGPLVALRWPERRFVLESCRDPVALAT